MYVQAKIWCAGRRVNRFSALLFYSKFSLKFWLNRKAAPSTNVDAQRDGVLIRFRITVRDFQKTSQDKSSPTRTIMWWSSVRWVLLISCYALWRTVLISQLGKIAFSWLSPNVHLRGCSENSTRWADVLYLWEASYANCSAHSTISPRSGSQGDQWSEVLRFWSILVSNG